MNWMDLKIRRELRRIKRQMSPRTYVVGSGGAGGYSSGQTVTIRVGEGGGGTGKNS